MQEAIKKWIEWVLPPVFRCNTKGLINWDSSRTHRAKAMKDYLKFKRIDQIMLPFETTPYLQSPDIVSNKIFKDYIREEINSFIEHRQERNRRGNLVKPNPDEIVQWVSRSWARITPTMIDNAIRAAYIVPGQRFEGTYIYSQDRLGPLVIDGLIECRDYIRNNPTLSAKCTKSK